MLSGSQHWLGITKKDAKEHTCQQYERRKVSEDHEGQILNRHITFRRYRKGWDETSQ